MEELGWGGMPVAEYRKRLQAGKPDNAIYRVAHHSGHHCHPSAEFERICASIAERSIEVTMKRGLAPLPRCSALPITRRVRLQRKRRAEPHVVIWTEGLVIRLGL